MRKDESLEADRVFVAITKRLFAFHAANQQRSVIYLPCGSWSMQSPTGHVCCFGSCGTLEIIRYPGATGSGRS